MITNQSTIEAANTYIDGEAAKQKYLYLHPAGQFLIQANSRSAGKSLSLMEPQGSFTCIQEHITG
jgi:hypothetical protein